MQLKKVHIMCSLLVAYWSRKRWSTITQFNSRIPSDAELYYRISLQRLIVIISDPLIHLAVVQLAYVLFVLALSILTSFWLSFFVSD